MNEREIAATMAWLVGSGLAGMSESDLLHGFCKRCEEADLQLSRALAIVDTLHPIYEGRVFRWRNDGVTEEAVVEYGRTTEGEPAESWRRSVFYHLLTHGGTELRRRIGSANPPSFCSSR